jgi:phenylacetate-coenzyme A ligase PaaK-like adenylate-forming protein
MTCDEACAIVKTRLAQREKTFLRVVERSIYGNPRSPYRALLQHAGCEPEDLRTLVQQRGLEGALHILREQGVYVAFEEFKGRMPIVRNGFELSVAPHDFDNPVLVNHFYTESSGSTGVSTRIPHDLDQYAALSPNTMLARAAYHVLETPHALWVGILPDGSGINQFLYAGYYGQLPEKWFSNIKPFAAKDIKYTLATYYFCVLARLYGAPVPFPQYLPTDQAIVIARWAADAVQRHGKCLITAMVSSALRVALAAQENGIDLTATTFIIGSEPVTPDKARGIEQSGARFLAVYSTSEAGRVGHGCAQPRDITDVHLQTDAFALIPYAHAMQGFDRSVTAFHLTTLLPSAAKLMLNVEMDDYGIIEERECGCLWGELGFTTHLRGIRSYRKLTGEGVTLVGSDMVRILERELPARFGGSPLDYQLLEQEDERGFTRLYLVVSPRIALADEQAVIDTVMRALSETNAAADAARAVWAQANTLQIKRMEPILNARGKFNPLHVQHYVSDS